MATVDRQPWWERPATSPSEPEFEPEREHLRAELARAWRARLAERQERQMRASQGPPLAA